MATVIHFIRCVLGQMDKRADTASVFLFNMQQQVRAVFLPVSLPPPSPRLALSFFVFNPAISFLEGGEAMNFIRARDS